MPSILSDDDKQTVKRTVPKASNKIQAVAVARLYVTYPDPHRWTYTGLQGAAVLANDLVGNTFWIKLVDVSPANRGVLWDQEIYDTFQYNQDRTFFHTFELEDCMAGLSFADEKEARQFKKKMDERESNAHRNTRGRPFLASLNQVATGAQQPQQAASKSRFGLSKLFGGHHHHAPTTQAPAQSIIPARVPEVHTPISPLAGIEGIDLDDPAVQSLVQDMKAQGYTEEFLAENADLLKSFLPQERAKIAAAENRSRAPPPLPPTSDTSATDGVSKRGPPPAAPPSRRSAVQQQQQSHPPPAPPSPPRAPSPPRPRFRAPPPLADAGKFAHEEVKPALPSRDAGPAPPPRPPKEPLDDDTPKTGHAVPPPFTGNRLPASSGPPPPIRTGGPPAPPSRNTPIFSVPPAPARDIAPAGVPPPPPRPGSDAPPPPPLPTTPRSATNAPTNGGPPPPPPLPPTTGGPPPPPPMPASSGPPPPPMPPRAGGSDSGPPLPKPAGRDGLLADIRGGARLRKVTDSEKRDRSAAIVPGSEPSAAATPSNATPASGGDAGLAGALASALAARKSKVSHSDDEDDNDDW